jgi:hypothetical protein
MEDWDSRPTEGPEEMDSSPSILRRWCPRRILRQKAKGTTPNEVYNSYISKFSPEWNYRTTHPIWTQALTWAGVM